ncbi:MAG: molybdopterin-dependent oxidoreductase, partial [Dehalococcoidia bacterium]|nr:molybdopterin-dependent oxidoreductase [Dehalococcoidia bacterium]
MRIDRLLLFPLCGLALFTAYAAGCTGGIPPEQAKELEAVQVKEYQGEKLSSVTDFRENSIKGPQHIIMDNYTLKVSGLVEKPSSNTYEEVIKGNQRYTKVVGLDCVEGCSVKILWEGVRIKDLIEKAGVLPTARVIIFHAYDGYTTALPLN